jgi:DNA-binding NarL/FixJ family response regulator
MDNLGSEDSRAEKSLENAVETLGRGVVLINAQREIVWMDDRTRTRLNGGGEQFAAALRAFDDSQGVHCCLHVHEVAINGETTTVCLVEKSEAKSEGQGFDAIAAVEAAMADATWFTRAIVEKLKALRPAEPGEPKTSDLDILSDREREVLGLICEGRSDAQMGSMLNLSQNTIRNHIASLYRKIGVNRRSAAIIWARERGITAEDALQPRRRVRPTSAPTQE